jgi:hypothetical protein
MKRNHLFLLVASLIAAALLLAIVPAHARSGGINGYSGITGSTCNNCHSGGTTPTVTLGGPTIVTAGSTYSYTLVIGGGQEVAGGLDVAVDAGTLIASEAGTYLRYGEVTHDAPRSVDGNNEVVFTFQWTAPATPQTATMYGAGNSVNLSGNTQGDRAATDTLSILVNALPAVAPTLTIGDAGGGTAHLEWSGDPANCQYDLYRSTAAYSGFNIIQSNDAAGSYDDPNTLDDPLNNYFYYVRAWNCGSTSSADSDDVGGFTFALLPGIVLPPLPTVSPSPAP